MLVEYFPFPSISLLRKIQSGGVDAIKSITKLMENGEMSSDIVLIFDEMYLQKEEQYNNGSLIGCDENGDFYKGIVVFMVAGLKKSIPYLIKSCPEKSISGTWLSDEINNCLCVLGNADFNVRLVVCDNHASNVSAFRNLLATHGSDDSNIFVEHPSNPGKTYLSYDNIHLLKNIRNNLHNRNKFVFDEFNFVYANTIQLSFPTGYISWSDIHHVYDLDSALPAYLRQANKLTYSSLHPSNNKQSVPLALAIFDEKTVAAVKSYLPERPDMSGFMTLIHYWWMIVNSGSRFNPNWLSNAIVENDGKAEFLLCLSNWVERWSDSPAFCLSKQTVAAFVMTLRAQVYLIRDLLTEDYDFVILRKLNSDPLEKRFSKYRQMSGGRFLVGLREVINSEKILSCRSLLLEEVNYWKEDLAIEENDPLVEFLESIKCIEYPSDTTLNEKSLEVAIYVAGYVSKKLSSKEKYSCCKSYLTCELEGGRP